MLEMVASLFDSEHVMTKRAVNVCSQIRRMRGDLPRTVAEASIHLLK